MSRRRDVDDVNYAVQHIQGTLATIEAEAVVIERAIANFDAERTMAVERLEFLTQLHAEYTVVLERSAA